MLVHSILTHTHRYTHRQRCISWYAECWSVQSPADFCMVLIANALLPCLLVSALTSQAGGREGDSRRRLLWCWETLTLQLTSRRSVTDSKLISSLASGQSPVGCHGSAKVGQLASFHRCCKRMTKSAEEWCCGIYITETFHYQGKIDCHAIFSYTLLQARDSRIISIIIYN